MKKFIIAALMLTASSATFAQFTNGGSKGGDNSDYNKVSASFTLGSFSEKFYGTSFDGTGLYGFSVGYSHGFSLSQNLPIFLEVGGEFNFHSGSSKNYIGPSHFAKGLDAEYIANYMERHGDDWAEDMAEKILDRVEDYLEEDIDKATETTLTFMNIAVPVNFSYRFDVSDKFSIAPYAGLNLKLNIIGKAKAKGATESTSFFKKDDFKKAELDEDLTANRFQLGMNLGVNCIINKKFSAGYRFQPDFIGYQSYNKNGIDYSTKITSHYFTFGYIF